MELNDYQTHCRKTAIAEHPEHMIFGLLEEAGEVAGIMKRFHRGDEEYTAQNGEYFRRGGISNFARDKARGELGDLLWYLAMSADVLGLTLEEVAAYNLSKLQRRKAKDMIHGSGDDR